MASKKADEIKKLVDEQDKALSNETSRANSYRRDAEAYNALMERISAGVFRCYSLEMSSHMPTLSTHIELRPERLGMMIDARELRDFHRADFDALEKKIARDFSRKLREMIVKAIYL
jgi:hypothetical protein